MRLRLGALFGTSRQERGAVRTQGREEGDPFVALGDASDLTRAMPPGEQDDGGSTENNYWNPVPPPTPPDPDPTPDPDPAPDPDDS
jgi:hypothetical protein